MRMSKCLMWKKFLHRKHLDNDRFSLSFSWILFLFLLFSQVCSHHHLNVNSSIYRAWSVCMCECGKHTILPLRHASKWAEERSWCSNIHKINFSFSCEVNLWRNIWNGSQVICVTDLAHPYNGWSRKKFVSYTRKHISALQLVLFFLGIHYSHKRLLGTQMLDYESHMFYNELNI